MPDSYDAVVVGGGPAGLAAATWLARYRRRVLVVDSEEYRNRWVDEAHGYLPGRSIRPLDLVREARAELLAYRETEWRPDRVTGVAGLPDGFAVDLLDSGAVHASRVVLATGVSDLFPEVDGFFEHYGADVFHCPTCDGYEAQGRDVVAFGWAAHVPGFVLNLLNWARSVTLVTDGNVLDTDPPGLRALHEAGVEVIADDAVSLVGRRHELRAVRLAGGREIPCSLAFFSIAHAPRNELAVGLGCDLGEAGCVAVDGEGRTSVPGVFAAGDLVPGLQLVQVAAGKGAVAGVGCARSLLEHA